MNGYLALTIWIGGTAIFVALMGYFDPYPERD